MDLSTKLRERSVTTLSRVERDDPTLKRLVVSSSNNCGGGSYWPNDSADLERLGNAIGNNTNLQGLAIRSTHELEHIMAANNGDLSEGRKRNASIRHLFLVNCDLGLSGGMGREMLNGFVANISSLRKITLNHCALGNGGAGVLASAVSSCVNLNDMILFRCNVDDDILKELVLGIRGLHHLLKLDLRRNNFGRAGCDAIATLLRDPNCNLTFLALRNNGMDDACATILANSLEGNRKLEILVLQGNNAITANGLKAFSNILCDTSSVNSTYLSNNTLRDLRVGGLTPDLSALLEMNRGDDKEKVAIRKILRHHTHLDMGRLYLEWDLKMLPCAVGWFVRARGNAQNDESDVDAKKLSSIYQFARALPMLFVPFTDKVTVKRKISDIN